MGEFHKFGISVVKYGNAIPWVISPNEISRTDFCNVTIDILYCCVWVFSVINLFMFIGNWDILTLLVISDIMFFMLVTVCRVNVMYGIMFILVIDLVVCIYVIYL